MRVATLSRVNLLAGLTLTVSLSGSLIAQGLPTAKPEDVGMSSERLARIDRLLKGYIEDNMLAGTVSLVARKGKVVHFEAHGYRHKEEGVPMDKDTIFVIMSMTKPIASTALMMLFEEGHFLLDDPVSRWLPEFAGLQFASGGGRRGAVDASASAEPQRARPITIRHALTHTTGLRSAPRTGPRPANIVEGIARATARPLAFNPGTRWSYGNSTDIVAALVEVISGQSLDEFVRERIFDPLGMVDTHYNVPESKVNRKSAVYRPVEEQGYQIALAYPPRNTPPTTVFNGTYGLSSTAADYFRFHQMMLNGGELDGVRLLSPHTVSLMITNHIGETGVSLVGPGYGFGLGYSILMDSGKARLPLSPGTFSWGGAWNTYFFVDPDEEIVAVFMSQLTSYGHIPVRGKFASLTAQAIIEPNKTPPAVKGFHRR